LSILVSVFCIEFFEYYRWTDAALINLTSMDPNAMNIRSLAQQGRHVLQETSRAVATVAGNPTTRKVALSIAAVATLSMVAGGAMAALPTPAPTAGTAASGDYIALMKEYWKQGVAVMVLIVGALGFLSVGGGGIAKFNDFRNGKAELGDLVLYGVIGVVVLVTLVYLLTSSEGIIT